ncbi:MAG: molybdate ABC transporter substrate-binding protein [Blastocatellia bacterium]|nr:molybdate ABC transporter substrate-binding protein [Blastocatellia bacterium]
MRTVGRQARSGAIRRARSLALVLVCALSIGCSTTSVGLRTLAVAAASDLQFAFEELSTAFSASRPGVAVVPTFGASGTLTAQIASGAPFDLFFSADRAYPERLVAEGHADGATLVNYAIGHIVVWVPNASPLDVAQLRERTLVDPRVRTVAIANPDHAPYGRAAVAAIASLGIADEVRPKLVFGENVAQAAQFAQAGAADVAVIARSLAVSPRMATSGRWWEVPSDRHPKLEQAAVVTSAAREPAVARDFIAFVTSDAGRAILERHGLGAP